MSSVSLEEKRLKQLKQQLFGKEQPVAREITNTRIQATNDLQFKKEDQKLNQGHQTLIINPISLKKDFTKIILLSLLAVSIQLSLFFAHRQGLIRLFYY